MRGFAPAAVSAHLRRRFRGCVFPALPFPALCASASVPHAQSPVGAAANLALTPRRPPHAIIRELVLPQNPRLCALSFRASRASFRYLRSIHARVCACLEARVLCHVVSVVVRSLRFRSRHRVPVLPPRARNRQQALPPSPRSCPVPHVRNRPCRSACHSVHSIHARVCTCRCARAFALAFPGLHIPCASVPGIARQCFRPAHAIASRRCRQARAHAPPSRTRNRQHSTRRQARAHAPAPHARNRPRRSACHSVHSIHARVCTCRSVRAFAPSFPWLRVPCASVPASHAARPVRAIADKRCRQARTHAPAPHACNRQQALPPNPCPCPAAPRA